MPVCPWPVPVRSLLPGATVGDSTLAKWGTISFYVRDENGDLFLVSCSHVLAPGWLAQPGDRVVNILGVPIATLAGFTHPFHLGGEKVDGAVAKLLGMSPDCDHLASFRSGGRIEGVVSTLAPTDTSVFIVGARSGRRQGTIRRNVFRRKVNTDLGQVVVEGRYYVVESDDDRPIARQGDSGASLCTLDGRLLGTVFAVDLARRLCVAQPIQPLLASLAKAHGLGLTVIAAVP